MITICPQSQIGKKDALDCVHKDIGEAIWDTAWRISVVTTLPYASPFQQAKYYRFGQFKEDGWNIFYASAEKKLGIKEILKKLGETAATDPKTAILDAVKFIEKHFEISNLAKIDEGIFTWHNVLKGGPPPKSKQTISLQEIEEEAEAAEAAEACEDDCF